MKKVFNTGESSEELRERYNPDGSVLRKAQLIMLDMMIYIDKVCREQKIAYRLDSGNVLGAVRHGGFIPWDDDVDLVLERNDYERLCKYLIDHPHPRYILQSNKTDSHFYASWNAFRDTKSEYIQPYRIHKIRKYRGLNVDLFPYEAGLSPFWHRVAARLGRINDNYFVGIHPRFSQVWYKMMKNIVRPLFNLFTKSWGDKNYYMHSYWTGFNTRFHKDVLFPYKPIIFEGYEFMGPANPEEYLRIVYGDYMNLPPIDERNHHEASIIIYEDL